MIELVKPKRVPKISADHYWLLRQSVYQNYDVFNLMELIPKRPKGSNDWIYIIKNPATGFVKIGITGNVKKRIAQLISMSGIYMELIASYKETKLSARGVENFLHMHYRYQREIGEWFTLSDGDVKEIDAFLTKIFTKQVEQE